MSPPIRNSQPEQALNLVMTPTSNNVEQINAVLFLVPGTIWCSDRHRKHFESIQFLLASAQREPDVRIKYVAICGPVLHTSMGVHGPAKALPWARHVCSTSPYGRFPWQ